MAERPKSDEKRTAHVEPGASESVSIYDVAERARVSITTVSRVLNQSEGVAAKTRKRVEETIKELNYRPSNHARGLMLRRSDTIGLIIPDLGGDYYGELMRGIDKRAKEVGMHLMVTRASGEKEELEAIGQTLGTGRVDGLIIAIADNNDEVLRALFDESKPLVVLDRDVQHHRIDGVRVDNRTGAREATEHLIKAHGVRRLVFLGGPADNVDTVERADGFRDALGKQGLPPDAGALEYGDYTYDCGYRFGERLAEQSLGEKFGIVAANDDLARGAIDALFRAGIVVPDHGVLVVGYDDSRLARFARPTLTTVHIPLAELGSMAIDMILDRIAGRRSQPIQLSMKANLVVRQSCGCEPCASHQSVVARAAKAKAS